MPGWIEIFTVDVLAESANAEERSLFRRIKKAVRFWPFFLFLCQILTKMGKLERILFLLSPSLMELLVAFLEVFCERVI